MINHKHEKGESSSTTDEAITVQTAAHGQPAAPTAMRSSVKNLFAFTRPTHVWLIVSALCGSAVVAAGRTAYAILLGNIFQVCTSYGAGEITAAENLGQTSQWCLYMFILGLGMWVFCSIDVALWVVAGELRAKTTRETLYSTLLGRSAAWFDRREHGMSSLMTTIQTQTRELQLGTSQVLGFLVCDLLVFASCIIIAFYYSYQLTLVMLSTAVPSALILWLIARFLDPAIAGQKHELAEAAKHATAATTAIDLVKAYNAADHESFNFISAVKRSSKYYTRQVLCNCGQMSYIKLWMMSLFVLGFYLAVVFVNKGDLTPGNALTTFYCALIAFQSIGTLGPQWLILAKGMAAGQSLQELVRQADPGQTVTPQETGIHPSTCHGDISLSNISFAYPSSPSNLVLHPSSFHFPSGSLTFIVGRSGSGKSTLGNLLARFYEPLTGQITVDGQPITRLDLPWVRQNITLIQQSSVLFNDSLFQNVAFGGYQPDQVTVEDVKEACSMALLQTTIAGMPQGLDTQIGPGGYSLSGGQRQHLALARAKIRDPPVLILDEITCGLDPVSRGLIMDAIRIWRRGKTTIIITHEVGCIGEGEMVYVMDGGRVVQQGHGKHLREEREGLFAALVASADHDDGHHDKAVEYSEADDEGEQESDLDDIDELEEEDSEEEVIKEATYVQLARGLSLRNHRGSIVFPRLTFGFDLHPSASTDNNKSSRLTSRRFSAAGKAPIHHLHPHANTNPDRIREVSPLSKDGHRHSTSSIELITQTGLSVKNTRRVSNARRTQHPDPKVTEAQLNGSMDSLELVFLEKLANKKQRQKFYKKRRNSMASIVSAASHSSNPNQTTANKNKQKLHSINNRLPSLSVILRTVWPTLDLGTKAELLLGICLCLVVAGANPSFSFVFAQLLSSFWSSPSARVAAGSKWAGILAAVAIIDALATFGSFFFLEKVANKWVTTLRAEAMTRILAQPKSWFAKSSHSPAKIVACLDRNAEEMRKLVGMFVPILVTVSTLIVVAIVWALTIQWDLTLVTLLGGLPAAVIAGRLNAVFSDKWESRCDGAALRTGQVLSETFETGNLKVVRALTLEKHFATKYASAINHAYQLGLKRATYVGLFFGLNQSIAYYLTALIFYYGAKILSQDRASVTDLLRVINLMLFSLGTCVNMLANVPQIAAAKATATQMLYFANLSYEGGHESQGTQRVSSPLPVVMRNLRFAYPGAAPDTLVLRNLNLRIEAGECLAVVGESGCGKSTVAGLLINLYPPLSPLSPHDSDSMSPDSPSPNSQSCSSLTYNSIPSSQIHTPSLRSLIAYIPQHPFLLPTTLRENILYGLPDSSSLRLPENQHLLHRAAQLASIHEFIISLPDGYDTAVGEGSGSGLQLSGGQAQRVSIARAIIRSPKLIVADEPTASLDAEGAEAVREVFARLVRENRAGSDGSGKEANANGEGEGEGGMAIVVVTHSKEMMRMADRVVMIENGTVIEEGPYLDLVAKRGGRFEGMVSGGAWDAPGGVDDSYGSPSLPFSDQGRQRQYGHQDQGHRTMAAIHSSDLGGQSLSATEHYGHGQRQRQWQDDENGVSDLSGDDEDYEKPRPFGTGSGSASENRSRTVNEEALRRLEGTSPDSSTERVSSAVNQSPSTKRGRRSTWGWRLDN
ncbi:P-loop containing nucleoside triphosphate hydrolase protein [Pseudoneurospora amorphoporcata]|uniref:P-loop containing nucleoside triphosphate hydrolase protein n=1 Tax=Pseudoneurospora amorphoporcata TaxID=241081 RepID=A0AAN6SF75_9PEZI|nr:P-loop containing nucleoside triphosphate hydrolase protein [Pseudoneurospora amorphoporcata]